MKYKLTQLLKSWFNTIQGEPSFERKASSKYLLEALEVDEDKNYFVANVIL